MSRLVKSELLKQRTTRTSLLLLLWMTALILLVVLLHVLSLSTDHISTADGQLKVVGWGTSIAALFASLLGVMSITVLRCSALFLAEAAGLLGGLLAGVVAASLARALLDRMRLPV